MTRRACRAPRKERDSFLGFHQAFSLRRKDGTDRIVFIKINDNQYLELFAEAPRSDGHIVEIVQYEPDSWTSREKGKFMPDTRISTHMSHFGILIGPLAPAMQFYRDLLGFKETWRGSGSPRQFAWVNMKVPDSDDYMEFMLYSKEPDAAQRGTKNHICLVVPDVQKAIATLEARPARKSYTRTIEMQVGVKKRQANLYDPDGTRVELMEPNTVDGQVVPSSTAPPAEAVRGALRKGRLEHPASNQRPQTAEPRAISTIISLMIGWRASDAASRAISRWSASGAFLVASSSIRYFACMA